MVDFRKKDHGLANNKHFLLQENVVSVKMTTFPLFVELRCHGYNNTHVDKVMEVMIENKNVDCRLET